MNTLPKELVVIILRELSTQELVSIYRLTYNSSAAWLIGQYLEYHPNFIFDELIKYKYIKALLFCNREHLSLEQMMQIYVLSQDQEFHNKIMSFNREEITYYAIRYGAIDIIEELLDTYYDSSVPPHLFSLGVMNDKSFMYLYNRYDYKSFMVYAKLDIIIRAIQWKSNFLGLLLNNTELSPIAYRLSIECCQYNNMKLLQYLIDKFQIEISNLHMFAAISGNNINIVDFLLDK